MNQRLFKRSQRLLSDTNKQYVLRKKKNMHKTCITSTLNISKTTRATPDFFSFILYLMYVSNLWKHYYAMGSDINIFFALFYNYISCIWFMKFYILRVIILIRKAEILRYQFLCLIDANHELTCYLNRFWFVMWNSV